MDEIHDLWVTEHDINTEALDSFHDDKTTQMKRREARVRAMSALSILEVSAHFVGGIEFDSDRFGLSQEVTPPKTQASRSTG